MTDTELMAAALRYARRGWPVFPCRPGAKRPLTEHGLHEATTDADQITEWWTRWPDANVAIATGHPGPDVVDIDTKGGAPGAETRAKLAQAGLLRGAFAEIITASGGQHLYYLGTDQRNGSIKRHGIDFRSAGGYVIAPPSVVTGADGGRYVVNDTRPLSQAGTVSWEAIKAFLTPPRPARAPRRGRLVFPENTSLAKLLDAPVDVGERSDRFFLLVAAARREGLTLGETVQAVEPWCWTHDKYVGRVDREVERVWDRLEADG